MQCSNVIMQCSMFIDYNNTMTMTTINHHTILNKYLRLEVLTH